MIDTTARPLGFALKSRTRRRLYLVICWAMAILLVYGFWKQMKNDGGANFPLFLPLYAFLGLTAMFGGVRNGGPIKPFAGLLWPLRKPAPRKDADETPWLDERDQARRDRIHLRSYTVVRWSSLLLFFSYLLHNKIPEPWVHQFGPPILFAFVLLIWILPQSMILWTEPDMEETR